MLPPISIKGLLSIRSSILHTEESDDKNIILSFVKRDKWQTRAIFEIILTDEGKRYEYKVVDAVDIAIHKLPYIENLYRQAKYQMNRLFVGIHMNY